MEKHRNFNTKYKKINDQKRAQQISIKLSCSAPPSESISWCDFQTTSAVTAGRMAPVMINRLLTEFCSLLAHLVKKNLPAENTAKNWKMSLKLF